MMHAPSAGQLQPVSIKEVSLDLTTNLASVGVLAWVLRQAGTLDDGSAQYNEQAVSLAADRARSHAQRRANSFIHDHILSALIAVANGLPDREALRPPGTRLTQHRDNSDQPGYCQDATE